MSENLSQPDPTPLRRRLALLVACALLLIATSVALLAGPPESGEAESSQEPHTSFVAVDMVPDAPEAREALAPAAEDEDAWRPGQRAAKKNPKRKAPELKHAVLQVVTNFDKADVTVNGLAYPEYVPLGDPEGMVLPAGGPYRVEVKYGEKSKVYRLHLRANETRLLFVELSGYKGASSAPPAAPAKKAEEPKKVDKKKENEERKKQPGKVTVYSKPPGAVVVDGTDRGEKTPGTVEVEDGRHEVQVRYEDGVLSEKKVVRVRKGSRIKLFFRQRKKD